MTLPEGFHWTEAYQHQEGPPRMLALGSTGVARLEQRVDNGAWFILLDYHLPYEQRCKRQRNCTTFASGQAGAEMWVCRHEARLRREIAEINAARPKHLGAG
ncbi:hypothetical protein NC00_01130 [Xanthomonas cannabis pv. phaseoli]|uniref:Transposase n=1 Tax=Xanthomonas cannabis pv. phaseoli TaxID=1885902 RepID=A0AB34PDL7_9XANT|nr:MULTISPECIES: hypothetical protein [Xanthomonas]KGK59556.1 hypothetical protein NC00_01130 [Xanthomonas cannabis pv. phaseoli]QHG87919.1 hypothetical protein EBN15_14255 [Xanthomonas cucurbitae]